MTIQTHLDHLRETVPGCTLTAFGDLSSGLILRSSAAVACNQDVLDALCGSASRYFSLADRDTRSTGTDPARFGTSLVTFTRKDATVYAREAGTSHDMVCVVIDRAGAIGTALDAARHTVAKIAKDTP